MSSDTAGPVPTRIEDYPVSRQARRGGLQAVQRRIGSRSQAEREGDDQEAEQRQHEGTEPHQKSPAGIDNPPPQGTAGCNALES